MKHCSIDFSSDEDMPLVKLTDKKKHKENYKEKDLFKFRQEKCEFCEKLLFCSYDMLVHNAKHIIIPLKNDLAKCSECHMYFASAMELEIHTKIHHFKVPDILLSFVKNKPIVKCDNSVTDLIIQNNEKKLEKIIYKQAVVECDSTVTDLINEKKKEKLKDFVMKQPIVRCEDTIGSMLKDNVKNKCGNEKLKHDLINTIPKVVIKKHDLILNIDKDENQEICKEKIKQQAVVSKDKVAESNNFKTNGTSEVAERNNIKANGTSNISSRIIFEDDAESDYEEDIISTNNNGFGINPTIENEDICDLTLDSDDELMDNDVLPNTHANSNNDSMAKENAPNRPLNSNEVMATVETNYEKFEPAIHYEDLMEPSHCECQRCGMSYSNRYDLIMHETGTHLKINQKISLRSSQVCHACDRHIAGNHWSLKKHIKTKHPDITHKYPAFRLKNCLKCKLKYYVYAKHSKIYHYRYHCKICSKVFDSESQLADHAANCKSNFDPTLPQVFEERIGMEKILKVCELCCLFFRNTQTLKYVPLRDYSEQGKRVACQRCEKEFFVVKLIKFINKHPIVQPFYEYPKKTTHAATSNEKRLKKIRQRLKLMNKKFK